MAAVDAAKVTTTRMRTLIKIVMLCAMGRSLAHEVPMSVEECSGRYVHECVAYLVQFDCDEAVIRWGANPDGVSQPDPLGCPVIRVLVMDERVKLGGLPWLKDGELRVEFEACQG